MKTMISKILVTLVMLTTSMVASASDFYYCSYGYKIISETDKTCELSYLPQTKAPLIWATADNGSWRNEYTVISIGFQAVCCNRAAETVSIPSTIINIGKEAFIQDTYLESVFIKNTTSIPTLGENAFKDCSPNLVIYVPQGWKEKYMERADWNYLNIQEFDTTTGKPIETAVESLTAEPSESTSSVYNLAGQKMTSMHKGINIVNGKKYLVK